MRRFATEEDAIAAFQQYFGRHKLGGRITSVTPRNYFDNYKPAVKFAITIEPQPTLEETAYE